MVARCGWVRDLSTEDTAQAEDQSAGYGCGCCCDCGCGCGCGCICVVTIIWWMLFKMKSREDPPTNHHRHCILCPCEYVALRRSRRPSTFLSLPRKPLPSVCVFASKLMNKMMRWNFSPRNMNTSKHLVWNSLPQPLRVISIFIHHLLYGARIPYSFSSQNCSCARLGLCAQQKMKKCAKFAASSTWEFQCQE